MRLMKYHDFILIVIILLFVNIINTSGLEDVPDDLLRNIIKEIPKAERITPHRGGEGYSMSGPYHRREAEKSLRAVSRRFAIFMSNELSPLKICIKKDTITSTYNYNRSNIKEVVSPIQDPSPYFPCHVYCCASTSLSIRDMSRLIEIQPNICSLDINPYEFSLSILLPLTNLSSLRIQRSSLRHLSDFTIRFIREIDIIEENEIGIYLREDKIFCKIKSKEEIQIQQNSSIGHKDYLNPVISGLSANVYTLMRQELENLEGKKYHKYRTFCEYDKVELIKFLDSVGYISSLNRLTHFTKLKKVSITASDIESLPCLNNLLNLTDLSLWNNRSFSSIVSLSGLQYLKNLWLSNTAVADINPLSSITSLKGLSLSNTKVTVLDSLIYLQNLESLDLSNTKVSNILPLTSLQKLKSLDLSRMQKIHTFSPLISITNLEKLDVDLANIDSFSFLPYLVKLKMITIEEGGGIGRDDNYQFFYQAEKNIGFYVNIRKHDYEEGY